MMKNVTAKRKIVIICGPTGIGKTSTAIAVARRFNGEIIGADSMQIYKHMDIGTAKPDKNELAQARHHLVSVAEPDDDFDAGSFVRLADEAIEDIILRGKLPIVAGGTGLYIKALLNGLFRSRPICGKTIEKLTLELDEKGSEKLHERLLSCDPESASRIHPNDAFRIIRALEVFETTGRPLSEFHEDHGFSQERYKALKIGLFMDRKELYDRINLRVDMMLDQGLLNEVTQLAEKGYSLDLKSMQSIGYRHMGMFIRNEVSWEETVRLMKRDTRRYAKRQFTWFNKDQDIQWMTLDDQDRILKMVKEFLT